MFVLHLSRTFLCFLSGRLSGGDSSLLFGEISGSALAGIEAALSRFLKPLLSESDGWGKADTEQKVIDSAGPVGRRGVALKLLSTCAWLSSARKNAMEEL